MSVIVRYSQESDVSICEPIGVLEITKDELITMLRNSAFREDQ